MFWTDWDSEAPRIESSSMSGEGRKLVFHVDKVTDGAWPNGLSLDYIAKRIYWVDAKWVIFFEYLKECLFVFY